MMKLAKYIFHGLFFLFITFAVFGQKNDSSKVDYKKIASFMNEQLECDKYVFSRGEFPQFWWRNEAKVENEIGKFPLQVSYFNSNGDQVTRAEYSGRYGAVIKGTTANGFPVQRFVTLFCTDVEFDDYSKNVPIHLNKLKGYGIPEGNWKRYNNNEERFSFGSLKYFPQRDPDAAIFLAGLSEMDSTSPWFDSPRLRDRQWWITYKQKHFQENISLQKIALPQKITSNNFPTLNENKLSKSIYKKKEIENIRTLCRTWAEKGGVPNVTLIVHKGKIIFHEAFGVDEHGKPVTKDSRMWMASITKLLSGTLMMQFVDQGIIDLDAPVAKYLSELSVLGNEKLTVRHLFNHTNGLHNSGEWASDWNVALENQIAHVFPSITVGETFSYHRAGYALAGKIMERLTGRAVPYLFQENIFLPLGMKSAYADNTYGGLYCSAIDLARLGQMLMNKGMYNGFKFFSAETFLKMLPIQLPLGNRKWGVGTSAMGKFGLSDETFGHAAASGSIFRIDPKNELMIISARNNEGKSYREFESALIESCAKLVTHGTQ
ncbi:MAG: serine hydrolase domain-containing protein [Bacteroidota bacterium]|nr:serine hydrolase domain-containing protein [Bacteroidota bacterium]